MEILKNVLGLVLGLACCGWLLVVIAMRIWDMTSDFRVLQRRWKHLDEATRELNQSSTKTPPETAELYRIRVGRYMDLISDLPKGSRQRQSAAEAAMRDDRMAMRLDPAYPTTTEYQVYARQIAKLMEYKEESKCPDAAGFRWRLVIVGILCVVVIAYLWPYLAGLMAWLPKGR
jgi:hypothetical protein